MGYPIHRTKKRLSGGAETGKHVYRSFHKYLEIYKFQNHQPRNRWKISSISSILVNQNSNIYKNVIFFYIFLLWLSMTRTVNIFKRDSSIMARKMLFLQAKKSKTLFARSRLVLLPLFVCLLDFQELLQLLFKQALQSMVAFITVNQLPSLQCLWGLRCHLKM